MSCEKQDAAKVTVLLNPWQKPSHSYTHPALAHERRRWVRLGEPSLRMLAAEIIHGTDLAEAEGRWLAESRGSLCGVVAISIRVSTEYHGH